MNIDHHYFEALHVIAVFCWMVGMFYLPRLFVYHASVVLGSDSDKLFQVMERRLMNGIMMPSMLISILLGLFLSYITNHYLSLWLHIKFFFVGLMVLLHFAFNKYRKDFLNGANFHSSRFFKILNESVSLIFVVIVFLAVVKPFR